MLLDPGRDHPVDPRVIVVGLDRDFALDHTPYDPFHGGENSLWRPMGRRAPARHRGQFGQQGRALLLESLF